MNSSDEDDFGDSDNDALLYAATQVEASQPAGDDFEESPRPRKRQKPLPRISEDLGLDGTSDAIDDDDAIFAAALQDEYDAEDAAKRGKANPNGNGRATSPPSVKKPRHHFFEPRVQMNLEKVIVTQTQAPVAASQPWEIRGPIWRKSRPREPAVEVVTDHLGAEYEDDIIDEDVSLPVTRASVPPPRPQVSSFPRQPSKLQNDATDYLENLPSDAFSSQPESAPPPILVNSQAPSPPPIRAQRLVAPLNGLRQTTLFNSTAAEVPVSQKNKRHAWPMARRDEPPTHHKLDPNGTMTWVYPTNLGKIREYQYNIVARGLFHNLLVALPTGLGKTFIAATVMLNWYRWTQSSQIIFVAPTKPLVAQQVDACYNVAGIPRTDTTMLTGEVSPALRAQEWQSKRVFFMTPQTLINDLKQGMADPKRIVLIVVDEAHRATGAYAYVEVVKFVRRFNDSFRVLALTATPGGDVDAVQKVIDGLDIARVEIRTEQSLDIRDYVHMRDVEKEVFRPSEEMEMLQGLYAKAVQSVLNVLVGMNAFWQKDPVALTPYGCTRAMQQWMGSDAGRHANQGIKGMVMSVFSILGSLSHSMELLKYHGIGPFYNALKNFRDDTTGRKSKYRTQICTNDAFEKMMRLLAMWTVDPDFTGHPKLTRCREVILNHLLDMGEGGAGDIPKPGSGTRVMVFAHFRDSAEEIARVLKKDSPMIRPHVFVGQSGAKNSEGMSQKVQLDVIEKFKSGVYNVLIATSIGEEGLDIGEVDLIICYDSKASPLRMLQRMGRTGRKRAGKIVLFQMEGKEVNDAAKAKDSYEHMQGIIAAGDRFTFHDDKNRRIMPRDIEPVPDKREVVIPIENTQRERGALPMPSKKGKGKLPKRPPKKFHMPDNARLGFTTASRLDENGESDGDRPMKKAKTRSSISTVDAPPYDEVYLDEKQNSRLHDSYLSTNDSFKDAVIEQPNFSNHPDRQRTLGGTRFVPHGRTAKSFVNTMQRVHQIDDLDLERWRSFRDDNDIMLDLDDDPTTLVDRLSTPTDEWEADTGIEPEKQTKRRVSAAKPTKAKQTSKAPAKPRATSKKSAKPTKASEDPSGEPQWQTEDPAPMPAKKPRGRPPKAKEPKQPKAPALAATKPTKPKRSAPASRRSRVARSPGEAAEAPPSSAPSLDPAMSRATQGIDLGDLDTSDEEARAQEGDYRDDSDLASFIAEDDEEGGVRSSSVPRPSFDRTPGSAARHKAKQKGRGVGCSLGVGKERITRGKVFSSDVESGGEEVFAYDGEDDGDEDLEVASRGRKRKLMNRRVVRSEDEDEDEGD